MNSKKDMALKAVKTGYIPAVVAGAMYLVWYCLSGDIEGDSYRYVSAGGWASYLALFAGRHLGLSRKAKVDEEQKATPAQKNLFPSEGEE